MKKIWLLVFFTACVHLLPCQEIDQCDYGFVLFDGTRLFSMYESNQNYVSIYRMGVRLTDDLIKDKKILLALKILIRPTFIAFTHEEGHRSILTHYGIPSISQPFFNLNGAAYVKGVEDAILHRLRLEDLPSFIRLHTAGLESDYCITQRAFRSAAFNQDSWDTLIWDAGWREFGVLNYMMSGMMVTVFEKAMAPLTNEETAELYKKTYDMMLYGIDEEENEWERDIVGHDVLGMIRHLHNPESEFHRYTKYSELNEEEKNMLIRIGLKSLINIVNPFFIGKPNFKIGDDLFIGGNAAYSLAPFGDFIEQNIYVKKGIWNISLYAREAQNRYRWFPSFGIALHDVGVTDWFSFSTGLHYWMQPENLDFNTSTAMHGGAVEGDVTFYLPNITSDYFKSLGISAGGVFKTAGFMSEVESHKTFWRIRAGVVVRY